MRRFAFLAFLALLGAEAGGCRTGQTAAAPPSSVGPPSAQPGSVPAPTNPVTVPQAVPAPPPPPPPSPGRP